MNGIHTSALPGNLMSGGITPTMSAGVPLIRSPAKDGGIFPVAISPDVVRDDRHRGRTLALILERERASEERLLLEHGERVCGHERAKRLLR